MARKRIKITTKSPVSVTARKPYGQFYETLDYIPARTLRGAFAQLLLDRCILPREGLQGQVRCTGCPNEVLEKCDFYNLIKKGEVLEFGDCYVVHSVDKGDTHTAIPRILPATAVSCKYHPGFSTGYKYYLGLELIEIKDEEPHGVFDLLVKHIVYDEQENPKYAYSPKCPKCDGIIEPFGGHYQTFADAESNIHFRSKARMRRFGRSAMNRKTWSVQEGMLYSVQAIAEDNVLLGEIEVDEDADPDLGNNTLRALESLDNIGGQSSRGLGNVEIEIEDYEPNTLPVKDRIEELNNLVAQVRGGPGSSIYFTVDLQSDAILRGSLEEPTLQLAENLLKNYLKRADEDFEPEHFDQCGIKLERSYSTGAHAGGWSTAWHLPKYVQLAAAKGSVFLFSASKLDDALYHSLEVLERKGIGQRIEEGFGKIAICEQFHLEVEPK